MTKNCVGKDVSLSRLKVGSDEADDTECGRVFQARVLNSGWQVQSVAMLPPNADVMCRSLHKQIKAGCAGNTVRSLENACHT